MYNLIKTSVVLITALAFSITANAQLGCSNGINPSTGQPCTNVITTAVPFLKINTDARAAGMADVGIATTATANSLAFNASRIIFAENEYGVAVSYTPWLQSLGIDDIFLANLSGFKKLDERQAVGLDLKFFSLGQIDFTDFNGASQGQGRPREFSLAAAYVRKFSDIISGGINAKFINSRLASGNFNGVDISPINSFAVDLSVSSEAPIEIAGNDATLLLGATISNLGPKVTYTDETNEDFIPTNLGIGAGLNLELDKVNQLLVSLEFNKLLVPSPDPEDFQQTQENRDQSFISGVFGSFGDAPGGFREELQEITTGIGLEYTYDKQFSIRAGYFTEAAIKGDRTFFTVGAGIKYQIVGINFSYLAPTNGSQSPLNNTIRFGLVFDFDSSGAGITGDQL